MAPKLAPGDHILISARAGAVILVGGLTCPVHPARLQRVCDRPLTIAVWQTAKMTGR
jgi:hypothetical protein